MEDTGLVPVFYNKDVETVRNAAKACYAGGVRLFEFTNRGDFAHGVFSGLPEWAAGECPGMIFGAGSVVDAPTASMFIQSGACFIVGPVFNPEVARVCNRRNIPYIPGCFTPTEISAAQEAGCRIVKVFPGGNAGPSFVRNVMAPMPWTKVMVTGGVEPEMKNLTDWFSAGVSSVGMGSNLLPGDAVETGDWGRITALCRESLRIISGLKKR